MRYRNAHPEDFDACIDLLEKEGNFRGDPDVHASLDQLWRNQLIGEAFSSFQIFETRAGDGWEIVGFRNGVFVTDEFRREYTAAPFAQVAAGIWRRVIDGNSPILSHDEIAIANGKGALNLVITHFTTRHRDPTHPETKEILALVIRARQHAHFGYRIKHLAAYEMFGPEAAVMMKNIGYQQYDLVQADGQPLQDNPSQSTVFYWNQTEDVIGPNTLLSLATFPCPEPQFAFSKSKQRLIRYALDGMTDKEIAEVLGIRHDTIRHRWESIYQTVREIDPSILPVTNTKQGQRGAARRHFLLEYLRQHLEEVRPYKAPRKSKSKTNSAIDSQTTMSTYSS